MTGANSEGITFRPASGADVSAIADIFTAARGTLDFLPKLHSAEENRDFIAGVLLGSKTIRVALNGEDMLAFIVAGDNWIEHLYVVPSQLRKGIGSALLKTAMADTAELRLWCFQKNQPARIFYESHGFRSLLFTEGRDNEEQEPDILYVWNRPAVA